MSANEGGWNGMLLKCHKMNFNSAKVPCVLIFLDTAHGPIVNPIPLLDIYYCRFAMLFTLISLLRIRPQRLYSFKCHTIRLKAKCRHLFTKVGMSVEEAYKGTKTKYFSSTPFPSRVWRAELTFTFSFHSSIMHHISQMLYFHLSLFLALESNQPRRKYVNVQVSLHFIPPLMQVFCPFSPSCKQLSIFLLPQVNCWLNLKDKDKDRMALLVKRAEGAATYTRSRTSFSYCL